jgi:hypothetical protein
MMNYINYSKNHVSGVWRIKYNDELYKLFKEPCKWSMENKI